MDTGFSKADPAAWASALSKCRTSKAAFMALPDGSDLSEFETLSDAMIKAETALLGLPSPDLAAVIEKLQVIWDDVMLDETEQGSHRQRVIGDLNRFRFAQQ